MPPRRQTHAAATTAASGGGTVVRAGGGGGGINGAVNADQSRPRPRPLPPPPSLLLDTAALVAGLALVSIMFSIFAPEAYMVF